MLTRALGQGVLIAEEVSTENNVSNDSNTLYAWKLLFYLLSFS